MKTIKYTGIKNSDIKISNKSDITIHDKRKKVLIDVTIPLSNNNQKAYFLQKSNSNLWKAKMVYTRSR